MALIIIDGKAVNAPPGATILEVAKSMGTAIPTLCFVKDLEPYNSCMVCIVENKATGALLPSCSVPASEFDEILTDSPKVRDARKAALELLLSDHVGDCEGPCRRACPAFLNIPRMIRQLADHRYDDAVKTVFEHIPIPAMAASWNGPA